MMFQPLADVVGLLLAASIASAVEQPSSAVEPGIDDKAPLTQSWSRGEVSTGTVIPVSPKGATNEGHPPAPPRS